MHENETIETFATWYIAVFDNYHVKYPDHKGNRLGYKGKVLIILPPDYLFPEVVEIYIWDEGKIGRIA